MPVSTALNIADLRLLARRRLPRMVFDYIDGGADDERTLYASTRRYGDYELVWHALRDVSSIDLSVRILGDHTRLPFILSPTAAQRLFHPREGELAAARAAGKADLIYAVSTLATQPVEAIAAASRAPKWFQVYAWRDRSLVEGILERVRTAGFSALILTVDAPVAGNRERDPRNGFSIPPRINLKTASQALARPRYIADLLSGGPARPANFPDTGERGNVMDFIDRQFDRSITWDYARWLADVWKGPVAIKGLSRPDDARRAIDAGARAIWISNHGGRQLDTSVPTVDLIEGFRTAIGSEAELIVDGGIRRGSDILKALALGADAVAIGRAYLFGLAAGGEAGVARSISILEAELRRGMALLGCCDIATLKADRPVRPPR